MKFVQILKIIGKYFLLLLFVALFARAWVLRPRVTVEALAPLENFELALHITQFPNDPDRFVVTEKKGVIKWFHRQSQQADGVILDHTAQVYSQDQEAGLLSTAFHPDFKNNRHMFIFYALEKPLRDRVSRWTLDENLKAIEGSELIIAEWEKFGEGHHGGTMLFDQAGMRMISAGEGSAEATKNRQVLKGKSFLGTILRIDVNQSSKEKPYRIPPDNPFVGNKDGIREEVFAYGFRNPWRFTIDRETGVIIEGDVGESHREEINIVQAGKDYGWPDMEGELCYPSLKKDCDQSKLTLPAMSFDHEVSRSITAGVIYRGNEIPWLKGQFVFGDYLRGLYVGNLNSETQVIHSLFDSRISLIYFKMLNLVGPNRGETNSFVTIYQGLDQEIYLSDLNGVIYKLKKASFSYQLTGFLFKFLSFK